MGAQKVHNIHTNFSLEHVRAGPCGFSGCYFCVRLASFVIPDISPIYPLLPVTCYKLSPVCPSRPGGQHRRLNLRSKLPFQKDATVISRTPIHVTILSRLFSSVLDAADPRSSIKLTVGLSMTSGTANIVRRSGPGPRGRSLYRSTTLSRLSATVTQKATWWLRSTEDALAELPTTRLRSTGQDQRPNMAGRYNTCIAPAQVSVLHHAAVLPARGPVAVAVQLSPSQPLAWAAGDEDDDAEEEDDVEVEAEAEEEGARSASSEHASSPSAKSRWVGKLAASPSPASSTATGVAIMRRGAHEGTLVYYILYIVY